MNRRDLLILPCAMAALGCGAVGAAPGGLDKSSRVFGNQNLADSAQQQTLEILDATIEIAPGRDLRTRTYGGSCPGPLLRVQAGMPLALHVANRSTHPESVHPHGLHLPVELDGTPDEGSVPVPPGEQYTFILVPEQAGTRWYHSHSHSHGEESAGLFTGQQGALIVDERRAAAPFDQEIVLLTQDWEKQLKRAHGDGTRGPYHSVNGRALGHGEPIRVRHHQRVLFRIVNGNPEEEVQLALAGHQFEVVALDGNPVPRRRTVPVLRLGAGERVDAFVEMRNPGVWILGDVREKFRRAGMGAVVEYAGRTGSPRWSPVSNPQWRYVDFGSPAATARAAAEKIELIFDRGPDSDGKPWRINGKPFWDQEPFRLQAGQRYRLVFRDKSNHRHPLHLHRHSFELASVEGARTAGIIKDTVCIEPNGRVEVEFVADQRGLSLFHCHMQNHMEKGFMSLFHTG